MGISKKVTEIKYLTLFESIETLKKYKELWSRSKDLINPITNSKLNNESNNSDNYDKKIWKSNLIKMMIYLWNKTYNYKKSKGRLQDLVQNCYHKQGGK